MKGLEHLTIKEWENIIKLEGTINPQTIVYAKEKIKEIKKYEQPPKNVYSK